MKYFFYWKFNKERYKLLLFIILVFLTSCKDSTEYSSLHDYIIDSFELSGDFKNFNDYNFKYLYDSFQRKELFEIHKKGTYGIIIFDLRAKKIIDTIDFDGVPTQLIDYKSTSINKHYLLLKDGSIVEIINGKKEVIPLDPSNLDMDSIILFPMMWQPFINFGNNFLCYWSIKGNILNPEFYKRYYTGGRDLVLKIKGHQLTLDNIIGKFPVEILENSYYSPKLFRTIYKNKIVYSTNFNSDIIISDISGHIKIIRKKSKLFHSPNLFDKSKYFDFNFISQYSIENDWYFGIYYIPEANKFIRVILLKMDYRNKKDGTVNESLDRHWVIEILNESFDFERAIYFPPATYDFRTVIPTRDGFLIMKRQYSDYNSKCYKYYVFKLSE